GAHPGVQAGMQVSVAPLVEVMRGERVTLDCTLLGDHNQFLLKWFLVERSGARHLLAEAQVQGSEVKPRVHTSRGRSPPYQLEGQGHLVLVEAQVTDEHDYVCVVTAAVGTAEATSKVQVFVKPETTKVSPNKGILSVMDDSAQEVPYMTTRTVREASNLQSLTSTLYLRVHKEDREASFHCSAYYSLPGARHGHLDSPPFSLTLHYPTEHVQFWVSPSTTEGWVREGDSVQLICQGDGNPTPEYMFYRLQGTEEKVLNTNLHGNFTLESVQRNQNGTYGCRVLDYDAADEAELSKTLELRVAYLDPIELSQEEELSLPLDSNVDITCSVQGLPTPALRWTKDAVRLVDGPTLSLSAITFNSAGTYICEAYTPTVSLLSRTRVLKLLVEGSPELKEEIFPQAEGSRREGEEVRLTCSARGYPEPKLTWSEKGGSPTEPVPGVPGWVRSSLTLKLTNAMSQHGVSCEASNPLGSTQHVFHFGPLTPQTSQAGVAVMAVAVSVGLLLLVVAAFYCMRRKGRPGCCRKGEKGAPPPGEPELSHSGSQRPEQTGLLMGGASGGARRVSGGFGDEC
ncbi:PREDICTED: basal cell adhesion molecule, partial [Myotis brandtii]|uniref:basal cell adhesion molecule n=1 Tax=Myotis brandtii TaxID=109478 RepID=UPI0007040BE4